MRDYMEEQLVDHEMNEEYRKHIESLTEEELRQEMFRNAIPEARLAADDYMNRILGKILYKPLSHAYNLEWWYRRRDLRYKPFLYGYIEGLLKEHLYLNRGTNQFINYTEDEIAFFAEQLASKSVPDNNGKKSIVWIASFDGFIRGYKARCSQKGN